MNDYNANNRVQSSFQSNFECPNCWGIQEWEEEYKAIPLNHDKDLHDKGQVQLTFIRRFVERFIGKIGK